jgi:hypothetical protein
MSGAPTRHEIRVPPFVCIEGPFGVESDTWCDVGVTWRNKPFTVGQDLRERLG